MKPYYADDAVTIYHADCREVLPTLERVDVVITDPPYGVTSLEWDRPIRGWAEALPTDSLWLFGSLRFFMREGAEFATWTLAQDVVWEKHNGSNFHADRFRRVHELVAQFYRGPWESVYKAPQYTMDATARVVRTKTRPPHLGHIERIPYESHDGGPRLQRSVIRVRSAHGEAEHPTQKPIGIVAPLIEYSCPPGGMILDPFGGSGTTARAAKDLGRRCILIEREERWAEVAAKRMAQTVMPLEALA